MKKRYLWLLILALVAADCGPAAAAAKTARQVATGTGKITKPVVTGVDAASLTAQAATAAFLDRSQAAQRTDQIVLVRGHQLSLWNRQAGKWTEQLSAYAGYGYKGYNAAKREGDGTTHVGSYPLLYAFGKENPGTLLPYRQITANSWFSSALGDGTYNTWVERSRHVVGEHLADYAATQYYYAIMIGYNVNPVVENLGSAIFLHCKGDSWDTAGCVSVARRVMRTLMVSVQPGAWIIIAPGEGGK